jgi:hypothetical protein
MGSWRTGLPAQLESFPQGETCGSHSEGRKAVEETMHAAAVMQEEIALNWIADAQSLRRGKPATCKRQPERNWRRLAFGILDLPPLEALKIVRALSTEAEEQLPRLFTAIKAECRLAGLLRQLRREQLLPEDVAGVSQRGAGEDRTGRFEQIVSEREIMLETAAPTNGSRNAWRFRRF